MSVVMAVHRGKRGIHVGVVVSKALRDCELQDKDAWIAQGYPNASQWSKALDGEAPLDLWRMVQLPLRFWQSFLPKLASALIRQFLEDETHDQLRMVKATLRDPNEATDRKVA